MQKPFDIGTAPVPPLRAEARHPSVAGNINAVDATSTGLLRATLGSAAAGALILGLFWLPAEYGIDPTGLGRVMGLTQMGEIKQQLYAEAEADDAALAAATLAESLPATNDPAFGARLDGIEAQLTAIAAVIGADQLTVANPPAPEVAPASSVEQVIASVAVATDTQQAPATSDWRDEVSYTLAPGDGIEVKLVMEEGATAEFLWTANGAVVNYDTHGDGGGNSISYEQGRAVPDQTGTLTAAFTGNHGWFWRNRTEEPVILTLFSRGDYSEMKLP